jgi:hypothetical protein
LGYYNKRYSTVLETWKAKNKGLTESVFGEGLFFMDDTFIEEAKCPHMAEWVNSSFVPLI